MGTLKVPGAASAETGVYGTQELRGGAPESECGSEWPVRREGGRTRQGLLRELPSGWRNGRGCGGHAGLQCCLKNSRLTPL